MKKYFLQYKPFFLFLLKFLGSYVVLILIYDFYLKTFDGTKNEIDSFTILVANQAQIVLKIFNFQVISAPSPTDASVVYYVLGKPFVRIVEGCNAMSVMILFVAFVLAFSGRLWKTIVFLALGVLTIYVLNVMRIALLTMGLFYYPEMKTALHDIMFPLFIYGVVFGLWVLWVNKFSNYAKSF